MIFKIIGFAGFFSVTYQTYSASTRGRQTCQETRNPQKTNLDNLIILLILVQTKGVSFPLRNRFIRDKVYTNSI